MNNPNHDAPAPLSETSLGELALVAAQSGIAIDQALAALRLIVPELLLRSATVTHEELIDWILRDADSLELYEIVGAATMALETAEGVETIPATPKETMPASLSGADRFEEFIPEREVVLEDGDSDKEIRAKIGPDVAGTRIIVKGDVGSIMLGGHTPGAISVKTPAGGQGVEIVGEGRDSSSIAGIKLDGGDGGDDLAGEIRIVDVAVSPEMNGDGTPMGDYAPLRGKTHLPGVHLILNRTRFFAPEAWKDTWKGFGMKWAVLVGGLDLTILDMLGGGAQEHDLYGSNLGDVYVERAVSGVREIMGADGIVRPLGNGRTHLQVTNRVPAVFPKGGQPSRGRIVYKDCVANRTGWEGLTKKIDPDGNLIEPTYGAGGGAAFTVAGHTGELVRLEGCRVVDPYANGLAVYADNNKKKASTPGNPEGFRCWMVNATGEIYDPSQVGIDSAGAWSTRRLEIVDFKQNRRGSRTPFLVAGTRHLQYLGVQLAGVDVRPVSAEWKLDYQDGLSVVAGIS